MKNHVAIFEKQTDLDIALEKPLKIIGEVHKPDCFIITTHSPDSNWQQTNLPLTCAFCINNTNS